MKIGIEEHALLYGLLVKNTCLFTDEEKGRKIMKEATVLYGHVRGRRMRSHADRLHYGDGIDAYMLCGEWQGEPNENVSSRVFAEDHVISRVTVCKWCDTWKKYDLQAYGPLYCQAIDVSLVEGFAGSFSLDVPGTLSAGDPECRFIFHDRTSEADIAEKKKSQEESLILPFSFHCREMLKCAAETLSEQVPDQARQILSQTENDFRKYRPEAADIIFHS